jgi:L-aminopeptidase/D-esterase-like protein
VLSGGSAYGLAAAHGVMGALAAAGRGVRVTPDPASVVPIVPSAILFDLGRGGFFHHYPGEEAGRAAYDDAMSETGTGPVAQGNVGAGTGSVAGGIKGGIGTASAVLSGGAIVAAIAAVNSHGSVYHPATGILYGSQFALPGEFGDLRPPVEVVAFGGALPAGLFGHGHEPQPFNTTIGVVATDLTLTKAQCSKLAAVGQDGLARAIRPAHTMSDGDTIFGLATCDRVAPSLGLTHDLLAAAADCFTRAVVHAVLAAVTVTTQAGTWRSYLDAFPSAHSPGVSS